VSAPAVASPRWLDAGLPCWRQRRAGHGLLAVVGPAATSWADKIVAGDDVERLVWTATAAQPERAGLLAARRPGGRVVCLAPAGRDLRRIRAAIQFAHRLTDARGDNAASARAHLTSADPPATVDRSIRIPHLISLRNGTRSVAAAVVWELVPRIAAPDRSRVPPGESGLHRGAPARAAGPARRRPHRPAAADHRRAPAGRPPRRPPADHPRRVPPPRPHPPAAHQPTRPAAATVAPPRAQPAVGADMPAGRR